MATGLSRVQLEAISVIERSCSVLSLLGCMFTMITFCSCKSFHKPINRLVFYASFGNTMSNVGTLISRAYLSQIDSVGCQFQAFLIQMFMPADAIWTFAMAFNVYLTFYHKFDAERLRKMEIPYLCICYGVPFIPALAYIFIKNDKGVRVYGNAVLWCWVSDDWDIWRVATFYGPAWVIILFTFAIYIGTGRTIYMKRKQLFNTSTHDSDPIHLSRDPAITVKTTEVTVVSEERVGTSHALQRSGPRGIPSEPRSPSQQQAYSITISSNMNPSSPAESADESASSIHKGGAPVRSVPDHDRQVQAIARRRNQDLNNAAWAYTKCAILFFTALLITWIPSSANRVYSVIHPGEISAPLQFMSSFVLPLQGFWNAIVYMVTSWSAVKELWGDILAWCGVTGSRIRNRRMSQHNLGHVVPAHRPYPLTTPRAPDAFDSESMEELARDSDENHVRS